MSSAIRFGIWALVHGSRGALQDPDEPYDASWERNRALVLEAEALGYDSTLIAQHTINPHQEDLDQLEAWTAAAALAALTSRIETVASLLPEQVIYLNTFSKLLASSFRTAFMVLPEPLLAEYRQKLDYTSCPVPVYNQLVLAEFLNEGHLERYTSRKRRKMQKK